MRLSGLILGMIHSQLPISYHKYTLKIRIIIEKRILFPVRAKKIGPISNKAKLLCKSSNLMMQIKISPHTNFNVEKEQIKTRDFSKAFYVYSVQEWNAI